MTTHDNLGAPRWARRLMAVGITVAVCGLFYGLIAGGRAGIVAMWAGWTMGGIARIAGVR